MMSTNFLSSFEESNPSRKQAVERWLLANVDDNSQQKKQHVICFLNSTSFFFTSFPDLRKWQLNFKSRVLLAIVDRDMKEDLVKCGLINWCPNVRTLVPVNVPRDGNCLLHAVTTAVWGITDKSLLLRRFLCLALGVDQDHLFQSRWLYQRQRQINQFVDRMLESGSQVMDEEWTEIRQCLDPDRSRSVAVPHRFLEPIHVYTLANILRRPIIVLTDSSVRTLTGLVLQDNDMGGIYLPLEWNWNDTCRTPLILGYSHSHFSPLIFADHHPNQSPTGSEGKRELTPLVNVRFEQFPVRFLLRAEEPQVGHLLRKYLRVRETVMRVNNETVQNVLCAEVEACAMPPELNLVTDFVHDCQLRFQQDAAAKPSQFQVHHPAPPPNRAVLGKQEHHHHAQPSASNRPPVFAPPPLTKERLQQGAGGQPQYGMGDPSLHSAGGQGGGHHQIHIVPPALMPVRSFPEHSLSLNPPPEQACRTVGCRFYGDTALGMLCSSCFRNFTIQESRQRAAPAGAGARPRPTAPLSSICAEEPAQLQTSMMRDKCQLKCGYYCSSKTYPYCHECASRIQKQAQEEALAAAFNESTFAPNDPRALQSGSGGVAPQTVPPPSQVPQESRENAGNINSTGEIGGNVTPTGQMARNVFSIGEVAGNLASAGEVSGNVTSTREVSENVTSTGEVAGNVTSSGEIPGNVAPNMVSAPQSSSSPANNQPPARGAPSDVGGEADPSALQQQQQTPPSSVPTAQSVAEALTQALVTGDPQCQMIGGEDPNPLLLFGSGQEPTSDHLAQAAMLATGAEPQVAPTGLLASTSSSSSVSAAAAAAAAAAAEEELGSGGKSSEQRQQTSSGGENHHQHHHHHHHHHHHQPTPSPAAPNPNQDLTSAACLAKSQVTPLDHGLDPFLATASPSRVGQVPAVCANQGCGEPALLKALCGKCYVGQNMQGVGGEGGWVGVGVGGVESMPGPSDWMAAEPVGVTAQKWKMMGMPSSFTHSSAPPSVGPLPTPLARPAQVSIPRSNATYTKEAMAAAGAGAGGWGGESFPHPESRSRSQPSSLRDLRDIPQDVDYTSSWIRENRFVEAPSTLLHHHHPAPFSQPPPFPQNELSGPKSPPQGLPEKPESVGLGDDLIASGAECFSSTQRCIGDGCGSAVPQGGKLCQQCSDILREARQLQRASAAGAVAAIATTAAAPSSSAAAVVAQAEQSQSGRQPCLTIGCYYHSTPQNQGYCTDCFRRHLQRELEGMSHHISRRTITVPPDFSYVHTTPEHQGQLCTSAGCQMFGDPGQGSMCFKHYQQHCASVSQATRGMPRAPPPSQPPPTITSVIYGGTGVYLTSNPVTCVQPGDGFPSYSQVSVPPPPPFPSPRSGQDPSLGETYYRVASRPTAICLNPTCSNFGNRNKGGLCNSCALDQKIDDDLISRAIFGEEETG